MGTHLCNGYFLHLLRYKLTQLCWQISQFNNWENECEVNEIIKIKSHSTRFFKILGMHRRPSSWAPRTQQMKMLSPDMTIVGPVTVITAGPDSLECPWRVRSSVQEGNLRQTLKRGPACHQYTSSSSYRSSLIVSWPALDEYNTSFLSLTPYLQYENCLQCKEYRPTGLISPKWFWLFLTYDIQTYQASYGVYIWHCSTKCAFYSKEKDMKWYPKSYLN